MERGEKESERKTEINFTLFYINKYILYLNIVNDTFSSLLISTFKYKLLIWSFDRKIDVNSNNMNFLE